MAQNMSRTTFCRSTTSPDGSSDVEALVAAISLLTLSSLAAGRPGISSWERRTFLRTNRLPSFLQLPLSVIMQAGSLGAVFVAAGAALLRREPRLAGMLLGDGLVAYYAAKLLKKVVQRDRPIDLCPGAQERGQPATGLGFPSGHAAVAAALAEAVAPTLSAKGQTAVWTAVALVTLARVYVGAHFLTDVVGGAALGRAVALAQRRLRSGLIARKHRLLP